jgi:NADH:ubiquinone oxidoreductase subunit 6 (subunit J)
MINIKHEEINRTKYVPIGIIVALVLMLEVFIQYPLTIHVDKIHSYEINGGESNLHTLGEILYT